MFHLSKLFDPLWPEGPKSAHGAVSVLIVRRALPVLVIAVEYTLGGLSLSRCRDSRPMVSVIGFNE